LAPGFLSVPASLLLPAQVPLRSFEAAEALAEVPRVAAVPHVTVAVGRDDEIAQAEFNTHTPVQLRQGLRLYLDAKRAVVTSRRIHRDGAGCGCAREVPTPPHLDGARHFSQLQPAAPYVEGGADVPGALAIPLALEGGVVATALEEVGEGGFEIAERLLQDDGGALGQPFGFSRLLLLGEQPGRLGVADT